MHQIVLVKVLVEVWGHVRSNSDTNPDFRKLLRATIALFRRAVHGAPTTLKGADSLFIRVQWELSFNPVENVLGETCRCFADVDVVMVRLVPIFLRIRNFHHKGDFIRTSVGITRYRQALVKLHSRVCHLLQESCTSQSPFALSFDCSSLSSEYTLVDMNKCYGFLSRLVSTYRCKLMII